MKENLGLKKIVILHSNLKRMYNNMQEKRKIKETVIDEVVPFILYTNADTKKQFVVSAVLKGI